VTASPDSPLRIVLADDHPIFRLGLRAVLEQDPLITVVAEADGPQSLLDCLQKTHCDVLISDFMMPVEQQNDGLRLLETIRRGWPHLPILVVTMLNNAPLFRSMLALGVRGLLGKASLAGELPTAIEHLRDGKSYIARSIAQTLQAADVIQDTTDLNNVALSSKELSPKELEVVRLLASGLSVSQIAGRLHRSKQTISAQKVSAMGKLGVTNDAALFIYLQEQGLS
jgi:two-component system capsular synthesis response regulator RcsB